MKTQLSHISFLQTFGILLVVLGHSFYRFSADYPVIRWIYGFHMPLFFFISGYLLRYTHADLRSIRLWGRGAFLTRKAQRLLVPYVLISSLVFVPKALMSNYAVRPIHLSLHDYLDMLVYPYHNVLGAYWFLPTLFLIFTLFLLLAKAAQRFKIKLNPWQAASLFFFANLLIDFHHESALNLLGVIHFIFYFAMGYAFRDSALEHDISRQSPVRLLLLTLAFSMVMLVTPHFNLKDQLTALNGILLSIALGRIYERTGCTFLNHLYGHTYTIYLFSGLFQILSLQVLLHFVSLPPHLFIPLAFVTGVYGPWLIDRIRALCKRQRS